MFVWEAEGSLDVCASVGMKLFVIERVVAGLSMEIDDTVLSVVAGTEGAMVDLADDLR